MTKYLVLEVSNKLFEIARDIPELLTCCGDVSIDGGHSYIDGAKKLFETKSEKELQDALPSLRCQCHEGHNIIVLQATTLD